MKESHVFENVPEARRRVMRAVKGKDTGPERLLRSLLHRAGYRFRKHLRDLPGRPDIVFSARRKAIFVHGCFWHQHAGCRSGTMPRTRTSYWEPKLTRNVARDEEKSLALQAQGWKVLVVWECDLARNAVAVIRNVTAFLGEPIYSGPILSQPNASRKS